MLRRLLLQLESSSALPKVKRRTLKRERRERYSNFTAFLHGKLQFESNENSGNEKQRGLEILSKMKAKKAKIVEEKAASIAGPEKV